jgi:hypothetical protein
LRGCGGDEAYPIGKEKRTMASPLAATDAEVNEIIRILVKARERPGSDDFLDGFPWTKHIQWYRIEELTTYDLENVYLFWDGTALGCLKAPSREHF